MAQPPPDNNFYRHPHTRAHPHQQLQLPASHFHRPNFEAYYDERANVLNNYNYMCNYMPNHLQKPDDHPDAMAMRRLPPPRRTRTTFTTAQIAELEKHFQTTTRYLTPPGLVDLSAKLGLGTAQVKIWFKNRRRRRKIQLDKEAPVEETAPYSPLPAMMRERELQCLPSVSNKQKAPSSVDSSGSSTSTTPAPMMPTGNHMDQLFGNSDNASFGNLYSFNNQHGTFPAIQAQNAHAQANAHPPYSPTPTTTGQFFPPAVQQQIHHHQQQQQQNHIQQQAPYRSLVTTTRNDYDLQPHKKHCIANGLTVKDFNFNNPYCSPIATLAAAAVAIETKATAAAALAKSTKASKAPDKQPKTTAKPSPLKDKNVYQQLTSIYDKSSKMSNGGNDGCGDSMDTTDYSDGSPITKALKMLIGNNTNEGDDIYGTGNSMGNTACGGNTLNLLEDCNGAFSKYNKTHETNYQCTMDTIMHSYNNHRNSSSNAQYTYCYN